MGVSLGRWLVWWSGVWCDGCGDERFFWSVLSESGVESGPLCAWEVRKVIDFLVFLDGSKELGWNRVRERRSPH